MNLDVIALYAAVANSQLTTQEILEKADIAPRTWVKAKNGKPVRAQTAGKIARALNVPVLSLLPQKK